MSVLDQFQLFEKTKNILRYQIPKNVIIEEMPGVYGSSLTEELNALITYYNIYDYGAEFVPTTMKDYMGSTLKYKKCKSLIDKEARFMFSNPPNIKIVVQQEEENDSAEYNISPETILRAAETPDDNTAKKNEATLQDFIDSVLKSNLFSSKLIKAAKDCFIGKRVALFVNFNENGISLMFANSMEFVYDTDPETDEITKIVSFFIQEDNKNKNEQRFYKKKLEIKEDGYCYVSEGIYDGNGVLKETITEEQNTLLPFVPAVVILNDGLTGDLLGDSEIDQLYDAESYYSKMANADMDAGKFNMNTIRYLLNVDPNTSEDLSVAPGALWDLSQDLGLGQDASGPSVGTLASDTSYAPALESTLKRLNQSMHNQVDVPDISAESLSGVITSGKTLKAIYWPLSSRVQEKMLEWGPKLEKVVRMIVEGAKIIPVSYVQYIDEIPDVEYEVNIQANSPIQEDETEEKQVALSEIGNNVLSRKSYLKRFYKMNDKEALSEIYQIAMEKRMIEDSYLDGMYDEPEPTQRQEVVEINEEKNIDEMNEDEDIRKN